MIPVMYLVILIGWLLLILGFYMKNYTFLALASFLLLALGVTIIAEGIADVENLSTLALGYIHFAVGAYVVVRSGYEVYKDKF